MLTLLIISTVGIVLGYAFAGYSLYAHLKECGKSVLPIMKESKSWLVQDFRRQIIYAVVVLIIMWIVCLICYF
jgi:hypothetical protein